MPRALVRDIANAMYPIPSTPDGADDALEPRLLLRDGGTASLRTATPADLPALNQFVDRLSPESRRLRFPPSGDVVHGDLERLLDSSNPHERLTLIAERTVQKQAHIVAVGSYVRLGIDSAEVTFAVADQFQGRGLGTALLERLAALASAVGFRRFQARALEQNHHMLEVFGDSGFEIRSRSADGVVDVRLSLLPSAHTAAVEQERHRKATVASLRRLLAPRAVAVVGASRNAASVGRRVLDALLSAHFHGAIYPVNPAAPEVAGLPAYPSAAALPPGVDLAVIAVPASSVLAVVDDCAAAAITSLVVVTAGFAEAGPEGRALQAELTTRVRGYGMRMVGPNCMGILNASPAVALNASFSPVFPPSGRIGLLSQSGALGLAILELAVARQLGLSAFVSVGNKADVSGNDLLEYWEDDPSTSVVLLYLESFGNPRRFARLARRIGRQKPIVAVKSGRTRAGTRAASSHTAALAASDVAVDALFEQSGVIRADTLDEMFDIAAVLDLQPLPAGRRVAIVTNGGGPGILAADACEAAGLVLPEFSDETRRRLTTCLPPMASSANPVDMIASAAPEVYQRTIEVVLTAPEIDALLVIFTPIDPHATAAIVDAIKQGVTAGRLAGATNKPVLASIVAADNRPVPLTAGDERVPTYIFPENAVRALGKAATYAEWRRQPPGLFWGFDDLHVDDAREVCAQALVANESAWLTTEETQRVLSAFGLPLAAGALAHSADQAAALAATMGLPVVAKLSSSRIQHKTDIGAVRVDLGTAADVKRAFTDIIQAARRAVPGESFRDVLIQPMIAGGVETMMGITHDPLFGPLIAFGLGGIFVEILGDVRFGVSPLTDRDVDALMHGLKGFRLLEGYRGHPAADLDALRELLLRLSRLAEEVPEIAELDLNPVIALPPGHGCRIVDARMRVERTTRNG